MKDNEPKLGSLQNFPTFPFEIGWGNLIPVRVIQIGVINRKSARFLGGMAVGRKVHGPDWLAIAMRFRLLYPYKFASLIRPIILELKCFKGETPFPQRRFTRHYNRQANWF
jgi:hypothetical protein